MFAKRWPYAAIGAALALAALTSVAAPVVGNRAVDVVGVGAASDPLIAVEANRGAIINRLLTEHGPTLFLLGISPDAFRVALHSLRADQLLAASLVNSVAEITAIVSEAPADGSLLQRFVALTPRDATSTHDLPDAKAYLVRDGEALTIVKAIDLQLGLPGTQVVGYFASPISTVVIDSAAAREITPKDGAGSAPGTWIGFTVGANQATGNNSAVAAGTNNLASGQGSFVGAGTANQANGISSLVIGGFDNRAVAIDSLVGAGAGNRATGARSVIVGGGYNLASGQWSFIGGGGRDGTGSTPAGTSALDNVANGQFSVIGGGQGNHTFGSHTTVAGGQNNSAASIGATVAGGHVNTASNFNSTVGGGENNTASATGATVAGGGLLGGLCNGSCGNTASNDFAAVGGGVGNTASGHNSTVAGGGGNIASGQSSTVAGGDSNIASGGNSTVAGGRFNAASGANSAVLGGLTNLASGDQSVAMGHNAVTQSAGQLFSIHQGAFVFSDGSSGKFHSAGSRTFNVLATGGVRIVTAATNTSGDATPTWTCAVSSGSSWACSSDRNLKQNLVRLNGKEILHKLTSVPIFRWNPRGVNSVVTHFGPTAQDFYAAFALGDSDLMIGQQDADGVALAAIQGLHQMLREKERTISRLEAKAAKVDSLERRLRALEAKLGL